MLESAEKISGMGNRTIYFGHGKPVANKQWATGKTVKGKDRKRWQN